MTGYDMFAVIRDEFCDDSKLLDELLSALNEEELQECAGFIARYNDIDLPDDED